MRIIVLDGHTLNPGDLSWDAFATLGELTVHERTPEAEIIPRAAGAEILLTNKTPLSSATIGQLPALRYIGVLATGYNVVDADAAAARGIPVTNVPEYGTASVVQLVFAHILNFCNHAAEHGASVRAGAWSRSPDFCFWEHPLVELSGLTLGIVGSGRIGLAVARVAEAFGMRVLVSGRPGRKQEAGGFPRTDLQTLFRESDVVSLHCPLTDETRGLVNRERIRLMKPNAFLINTSRGPLVVEADLAEALNDGTIAGAGLDVLSTEPPSPDNPLLTARNCCVTPHIAWATLDARRRLMQTASENLRGFLDGNRIHVVNGLGGDSDEA
jgi:glycerate dehydrogenase